MRLAVLKACLKAATVPLGILTAVLVLQLASWAGIIPTQASLMAAIVAWVAAKGAVAVFIVSVLENTAVFNTYFPGAIAILSAMALTHGNPVAAVQIWLAITCGGMLGQVISYLLGRRIQLSSSAVPHWSTFALTYWHPYTSSFTAFNAGSQGMSPTAFAMRALPSILAWSLFWGISMYCFGNFLGDAENFVRLIILYLIGWALISMVKALRQRPIKYTCGEPDDLI